MRTSTRFGIVPLVLAALLALPTVAAADIEGKGGFVDISFDQSRKVGTRTVQWLWWRNYPVGTVPYVLYAMCERYDENGQPVGKNRVKFRKVTLRGVDTDTVVTFRNRIARMRDGQHSILTWDAGEARTIAAETAVIGRAEVKIFGRPDPRDVIHCELGVAEVTGSHAQTP